MSLKEVILEIADEMLKDHERLLTPGFVADLAGYAKQLKIACKASPDAPTQQPSVGITHSDVYAAAKAEAAENAKKHKELSQFHEDIIPQMVQFVGGAMDKDYIEGPPPQVQSGFKKTINDEVYIYSKEENKMIYSETETKKLANLTKKEEPERKVLIA